jgi:xanthine dehydrogenase accessory factor
MDPTGSAWAKAWKSSCPATLRARGCWCLVPSTSPPPWPSRDHFSATGLPSAMPARCSPPEHVFHWPHRYLAAQAQAGAINESTVICVLTHDPKFDVPVLELALRLPHVGYVGAMGSRRTHDDRIERLRAAGLTDAELSQLSSPIGLDLGARTPEETAVSIAADIIARRWGGGGRPLAEIKGRIHHETQVQGELKDYLTRH